MRLSVSKGSRTRTLAFYWIADISWGKRCCHRCSNHCLIKDDAVLSWFASHGWQREEKQPATLFWYGPEIFANHLSSRQCLAFFFSMHVLREDSWTSDWSIGWKQAERNLLHIWSWVLSFTYRYTIIFLYYIYTEEFAFENDADIVIFENQIGFCYRKKCR